MLIYLHNVRGFGLGTVGLVLAANGAVSLVVGPLSGPVIDRIGGRWTLVGSLVFLVSIALVIALEASVLRKRR